MNEFTEDISEQPSKTQRKKEMTALQEIGVKLTSLNKKSLDNLPLNDLLRTAIAEYNRLPNSRGARRRQMQYIGRLMRDFDLNEIEGALARLEQPTRVAKISKTETETYCDQILLEGDSAINFLVEKFDLLERQRLRSFLLEYRKQSEKPDQDAALQIRGKLADYLKLIIW